MDAIGKKVLLGLGAGLSLAVSSFALYLLMKNDDDDDESNIGRRLVTNSNYVTVKVKVPQEVIGAIIGRGGENIKKLQEETKTRINFEDNNRNGNVQRVRGNDWNDDTNNASVNDGRVIIIRGPSDNVFEAENCINRIVAEQMSVKTEEVLIPESSVGVIIGKKGINVKQIATESGANVTVLKTKGSDDLHPVLIKGKPEEIRKAKILIDQLLSKYDNPKRNTNYRGTRYLAIDQFKANDDFEIDKHISKLIPTDESGLIRVMISAVKSPNEFWVQCACTEGIELDHLMDETTDYYEIAENQQLMKLNDIKIGDIVVAPYAHDEHWYRAKVITIEEDAYSDDNAKIGIFYLDYGDTSIMKKSQLFTIKEELIRRIPFQAIECSLANVVPKFHIDWSEDAITEFQQLTHAAQWKIIDAKPIETRQMSNKRSKVFIELYDGSVNIGNVMIEKGYAIKCESEETNN